MSRRHFRPVENDRGSSRPTGFHFHSGMRGQVDVRTLLRSDACWISLEVRWTHAFLGLVLGVRFNGVMLDWGFVMDFSGRWSAGSFVKFFFFF